MEKYNDYENLVQGYLQNYNALVARKKNLDIEIESLVEEIRLFGGAKIASYGHDCGSGFNDLAPVEREADRLTKMSNRLVRLQSDRKAIEDVLKRIDSAMNCLEEQPRKVILMRFIDKRQWSIVASEIGYSERGTQNIGTKAVKDITDIMFGNHMAQMHLNFVFVDE